MVEPLFFRSDDFGFRVAARYGLNFYVSGSTLVESGEYGPENREATYPEEQMWCAIVPLFLREIVDTAWYAQEPPIIDATEEEMFSALFCHSVVYFNAKDFACARRLKKFVAETSRESLAFGRVGTMGTARVYVSREIPQGYCYRVEGPVPELNWAPSGEERQVRPPLPPEIMNEIQFRMEMFRQDGQIIQFM